MLQFMQNQEYDWEQMKEIRLGLEENLDVSTYARPEYNWEKMEEIRLGLAAVLGNTPKKMDL